MNDLTHASFFSGVGGLDLGLERVGWRTVSFSEIDPYACAALAQRWPGVPNLGCIRSLSGHFVPHGHIGYECVPLGSRDRHARPERSTSGPDAGEDAAGAALWTGGFPCQDLSVAGKRRGLAGSRSGLAFAFLDLVGRHRPRFVLLENVPGLLSSHGGKDFGTLLAALVELGYGVGYRVLDARYFGVPQRRRRVFILGDSLGGRAGAERAAEVLSVGSRCHRHPPTGVEAGSRITDRVTDRTTRSLALSGNDEEAGYGPLIPTLTNPERLRWDAAYPVERASSDARRVRAPDELAGRSHDRDGVADTLREHPRPGSNSNGALVAFNPYRTLERDGSVTSGYAARGVVDALHGPTGNKEPLVLGEAAVDDPLLPLGLDSHRYRCCGNGVVADVGEWIGQQLAAFA